MASAVLTEPIPTAWLIPVSGPKLDAFGLTPRPKPLLFGRKQETCDLTVPADKAEVSREHARFTFVDGVWRVADIGSRWGTHLNGHKIEPHLDLPLQPGDYLRIAPWTFNFSTTPPGRMGVSTDDDTHAGSSIASADAAKQPLGEDLAVLLLESAAGINAARNETELAKVLLDVAIRGTGYANGAILKQLDASGRVEALVTRLAPGTSTTSALYSRSLLAKAAEGGVAELSVESGVGNIAQSIATMKITAAVCAPLMIDQTIVAFLYLDSRLSPGATPIPVRQRSSSFIQGLARMGGMAWGNLSREEFGRREASMKALMTAAERVQQMLLPARSGKIGHITYLGECRPGQTLGGDFFCILPAGENRVAFALGDVVGKGVPASLLMATAYGHLHARLASARGPHEALYDLSEFLCPRMADDKFITLWAGVFDFEARTLTYCDAGHGYAVLLDPAAPGAHQKLRDQSTGMVGMPENTFAPATVALPPKGKVLVLSDGIAEQYGMKAQADGQIVRDQFELEEAVKAVARVPHGGDEIKALFDAVVSHAGTTHLNDDATAVVLKWD